MCLSLEWSSDTCRKSNQKQLKNLLFNGPLTYEEQLTNQAYMLLFHLFYRVLNFHLNKNYDLEKYHAFRSKRVYQFQTILN